MTHDLINKCAEAVSNCEQPTPFCLETSDEISDIWPANGEADGHKL